MAFKPNHTLNQVKLEYEVVGDCHLVTSHAPNSGGYPLIMVNGIRLTAHAYRYTNEVGPVPEGRELHHKCQNRMCCNPEHLAPLTRQEHRREHTSYHLTEDALALRLRGWSLKRIAGELGSSISVIHRLTKNAYV